jgi:hypothetical protein
LYGIDHILTTALGFHGSSIEIRLPLDNVFVKGRSLHQKSDMITRQSHIGIPVMVYKETLLDPLYHYMEASVVYKAEIMPEKLFI